MQPDELKQLWNSVGNPTDAQEAFALAAWRSHRQRSVQRQLGLFSLWQGLQLVFWLGLAVYCGSQWWQQPPLAVMLSALALHAYCIAVIIASITRLQRRRQRLAKGALVVEGARSNLGFDAIEHLLQPLAVGWGVGQSGVLAETMSPPRKVEQQQARFGSDANTSHGLLLLRPAGCHH